jgi:hypothetical protein
MYLPLVSWDDPFKLGFERYNDLAIIIYSDFCWGFGSPQFRVDLDAQPIRSV